MTAYLATALMAAQLAMNAQAAPPPSSFTVRITDPAVIRTAVKEALAGSHGQPIACLPSSRRTARSMPGFRSRYARLATPISFINSLTIRNFVGAVPPNNGMRADVADVKNH
jgi:hypothetical protein